MQRKEYNKTVGAELLDELTTATGRGPLEFQVLQEGGKTIVYFPDDIAESVIDAAVAAHNPQSYADKRASRESKLAQDKAILRQWYLDPTTPARQRALLRVLRYLYGEVVDD